MVGIEDMNLPWIPANFLALPPHQSDLATAGAVLIPVPCDSTTSVRSGARLGPSAIIEASYGLEDYDWELDLDVSQVGIHTTPALEPHTGNPAEMVQRVRLAVEEHLSPNRMVGVIGGDHSVCIGSVLAHLEAFPHMSVLYLDAHADLRDEYLGTAWGHSSGARRINEHCPVTLAGIRSMAPDERDYLNAANISAFGWPPGSGESREEYAERVIAGLGENVYISIDLDVLDPSLMSAVGTPEPGGMFWHDIMALLSGVADSRRIVGFDVNELAPREGPPACAYTAAKLIYKVIGLTSNSGHSPIAPKLQ
ncbi:MAG: agmatinase [Chloroflexi bacterium]|nr:agmatinase [Chloroflexota bacterium]